MFDLGIAFVHPISLVECDCGCKLIVWHDGDAHQHELCPEHWLDEQSGDLIRV